MHVHIKWSSQIYLESATLPIVEFLSVFDISDQDPPRSPFAGLLYTNTPVTEAVSIILRWPLQSGVEDACKDAGLDDATASRFHDMALYAAYTVNASVRKSGQSAFTWIPLQGTVHAAVEAVPEAKRAAFTPAFIAAVTGVR